jgi:hypothetical protein
MKDCKYCGHFDAWLSWCKKKDKQVDEEYGTLPTWCPLPDKKSPVKSGFEGK